MTVYLRPNPKNRPSKYYAGLDNSGLITSEKNSIAIWTSRTTPNIGPPGPKGEDGIDKNSWFDTIIAAASDETSPMHSSVYKKTTFRCPYPLDLTDGYIRASLTQAPVGADFVIDIHMNGVTMFTTPIHIDENMRTSVGSATPAVLSTLYCPDDAEFEVYVIQVGSIVAGAGLKVAVTGIKTD